ncbi:MAG: hypothetical protein ACTSSP_00420, partial [Candidatus Asgardarchaeia archaeon]
KLMFINKRDGEYPRRPLNRYFKKIWKRFLLEKKDIDNFNFMVHHYRPSSKMSCPGKYQEMSDNFKNRIDKEHVIWKNRFINE